MDYDQGKLFIGGISWETTEEKLKEYFQVFGEVIEAVIMKDRATGRARGFGFVVFADPLVAGVVVIEKHYIDGRLVEAKKAVPREDHPSIIRNNNGKAGGLSPSLVARTKKIFVGGLPSSVTESGFRKYFEQFGSITDVVVMYDHNTQRPRGFGFITFDSEDAVDRVLLNTFHELNEKMVEVKRAIPKDLSSSPSSRHMGDRLDAGPQRASPYYVQGFTSSPGSPYGIRMDSRFGSPLGSRASYSPSYEASGYTSNANYGGLTNWIHGTSTYGVGGLYNGTGYGGGSIPGGYGRIRAGFGNSVSTPAYGSSPGRSLWGNSLTSYGNVNNSTDIHGSSGGLGPNGYTGTGTWEAFQSTQMLGDSSPFYENPRFGYRGNDGASLSSINHSHAGQLSSYGNYGGALGVNRTGSGAGSNSYFGDLYGSSGYRDSTWRATPADPLKAFRTGSGGLETGAYGLDTSGEEDVPNSNEFYNVAGTMSYKGVAV